MIRNEVTHSILQTRSPSVCSLPAYLTRELKKKYNAVKEFLPFLFSHKNLFDSLSNFEGVSGYFFVTWMKKTPNLKNQPSKSEARSKILIMIWKKKQTICQCDDRIICQ